METYDIFAKKRTSTDESSRGSQRRDSPRPKTTRETPREPLKETPKVTPREPLKEPLKETPKVTPREPLKETPREPLKVTPREPLKETPKVTPRETPKAEPKPVVKQETVELSQEEVIEKLTGYMPIPKRHWEDLARGDHVRWIERDGKFGKGGFFKYIYSDKENGHRTIQVESILCGKRGDQYYTTYNIQLEGLQALYRKPTLDYYMARAHFLSEIEKLRNEIRLLRGAK